MRYIFSSNVHDLVFNIKLSTNTVVILLPKAVRTIIVFTWEVGRAWEQLQLSNSKISLNGSERPVFIIQLCFIEYMYE